MNEVKENCEENNGAENKETEKNENTFKDIKGYKNINNIINYLITVGMWEMYTYEWLFNRKTYLYYHTLLKGYYFYDKNNNLTQFNDQNFFLYVCTFENTEFISYFFFNNSPTKIKLTSYTKTMQGRRNKQEDRFIVITDLTKYIDPTDYKTLFFYKVNPFYFFSIFDGHRGIKACEYCLTHIIINIIYFFYNQQNVENKNNHINNLQSEIKNENKDEPIDNHSEKIINSQKKKLDKNISINITNLNSSNSDYMNNKNISLCSELNHEKEEKEEKNDEIQNCYSNDISDFNGINKEDNTNKNKNKRSNNSKISDGNVKKRKCDDKNNLENIKKCKDNINANVTENAKYIDSYINNKNANSEQINKCEGIENNTKNEEIYEKEQNNKEINKNESEINNTKHNNEEKIKYLDELSDDEIIEYLKLAFLKTDEQFLKASKFPNHGCTIISLIIFKNKMYIANLGDCRALGIVNVNNILKSEPLSHDHKPNDPKEKERIKKMGGDVVCLQNVYRVKANIKKDNFEKPSLLERLSFKDEVYLAVSRAIGNKDFKHNNVISAMPDVVCKEIYDNCINKNNKMNNTYLKDNNEIDENYFKDSNLYLSSEEINYHFVIMACDGVWDTLSNKDVTQIIQKHQNDPDKACSEIIKTAYAYGSQDNLTAILLKFF
ncbi:protein phosphatase PPM9 [Plasmodium berghei]|uniref:Protein phosphatase PPM9 n=2 Tax=Plasmodium berghei TaxID=5821 RepID=A0A509ANX0_PLABA|nr:protein phosphatase PPM9 [Plasmodium berghei ANKA]CXI81576.1 protein phosphatase PPM9 [Plasmodium berghei]SCM25524.1 protein phosphatase PPM9 [Plasmodium berghei]SCN27393.1 protein phosphatase PPM9 [Plasmodium berghei]SCO62062.1 protein phosphatase PPM9 [Plasmodium berghei]SCO63819.1 protein phosphatase PPM9 [Plasmodium berghei]|eukprot:XP_034423026.1 protein phosphatase PPM9 [Plasmodium berghei ANKA]